jgi:hypothetical protein
MHEKRASDTLRELASFLCRRLGGRKEMRGTEVAPSASDQPKSWARMAPEAPLMMSAEQRQHHFRVAPGRVARALC